ncbi:MAG: CoA transferase [Chromatiales bacterium]|jgi:crotonobetainyl-CoA:carnitine CoA-transferase CaiB-like acyl-CoA transferase|nr:CoA transferase [Chromatiales bacterium]
MVGNAPSRRPLEGVRVLEMGQLIAGPFAGCILAYFGAEVIKIEAPGEGDPIRQWREVRNGTSFWWRSVARNKKCVTVNLREERGRELALDLANKSDVLLENFRPGIMEKWGLGPEVLEKTNPNLVYTRVSGYGQTGPYAKQPGFASVCEGLGGFRYVNGFPGEAPVRPNLSLGDSLAGLHAAFGVTLALLDRARPGGSGQMVDVAIYESMFNMLEAVIPEYDGAGVIREPSGSTLTGIAPTNTYLCGDGKFIVIGANGDSIFKRLMRAMDKPELADDPRFARNPGRVEFQDELDAAITAWTQARDSGAALAILADAAVPSGPIYDAKDMMEDPHFNARGLFEHVELEDGPLKLPAITPFLSASPGGTTWAGPSLGSHNEEIFAGMLGMSDATIARLSSDGII